MRIPGSPTASAVIRSTSPRSTDLSSHLRRCPAPDAPVRGRLPRWLRSRRRTARARRSRSSARRTRVRSRPTSTTETEAGSATNRWKASRGAPVKCARRMRTMSPWVAMATRPRRCRRAIRSTSATTRTCASAKPSPPGNRNADGRDCTSAHAAFFRRSAVKGFPVQVPASISISSARSTIGSRFGPGEGSDGLDASLERARVDGRESHRRETPRQILRLGPAAVVEVHARDLPVEDLAGLRRQAVPDQEERRHALQPTRDGRLPTARRGVRRAPGCRSRRGGLGRGRRSRRGSGGPLDREPGRIADLPVEVALAREDRARVAAAHRHDDVGRPNHLVGPRLGELARDVDPDLGHRVDGRGVHRAGRIGAAGVDLDLAAREVLHPARGHLRAARRSGRTGRRPSASCRSALPSTRASARRR